MAQDRDELNRRRKSRQEAIARQQKKRQAWGLRIVVTLEVLAIVALGVLLLTWNSDGSGREEKPVVQKPQQVEITEPATEAPTQPDTDAPATEAPTDGETEEGKKGCGGVVAAPALALIVSLLGAARVARKRDE